MILEMPRLKAPATLYNSSLVATRSWILRYAIDLNNHFGDYESVKCQDLIKEFNQYLITNVAARVIDELYNSFEILNQNNSTCTSSMYYERCPLDERILLSMYINKNMRTLTCHKIVNDTFWKDKLNCFTNLSKLDLNKVCTDDILEVVGKHCPLLEIINISSKLRHTRPKDRHNALKLQLCVSDIGLGFLSNCKKLKEIEMTCIIRQGCGGCKITNEGIKRLLISLPVLRRINYTDTGTLLDSMCTFSQRLALISLTDYHPSPTRIPHIEYLCPHLTELHLAYAFSSYNHHQSEIVSALSSSGLKISTLTLNNFPFDDALKKYLEVKGSYLKVFYFVSAFTKSEDTTKIFFLLGHFCPNLETLYMQQYLQLGYENTYHSFITNVMDNDCRLFCNLKSLVIKVTHWDSANVLPLLLKHALTVQNIILSNHTSTGCLDNTLKKVQETNPFDYLESVSFFKGITVSFDFLKTFISSCKVLKNLTIESDSEDYVDSVEKLSEDLHSKNVAINIDVYLIS